MGNFDLIASSGNLDTAKPKSLPFYFANFDPFGVAEKWKHLTQDERSRSDLEKIIGLNTSAVRESFFMPVDSGEKKLYDKDICFQACLLSCIGAFHIQKEMTEITGGWIDAHDLLDVHALFAGYGTRPKRNFRNSAVFGLSYFNQLLSWHAKYVKFPEEVFRSFAEIGQFETIQDRIKASDGTLYFDFSYNDRESTLSFDFNKQQTRLRMNTDPYLSEDMPQKRFSELLEEALPFKNRDRLNFIMPMRYGLFLPLINVTEIRLRKSDGVTSMYSINTQKDVSQSLPISSQLL